MTTVLIPVLRRYSQTSAFGLLLVFSASTSAIAHHGAVTNELLYETDKVIEFEGEITEVLWRNPHTRGRLKVVNDAGEETLYLVEFGSSPRSFEARGFSAEDFAGKVKVAGYKSKRRENEIGATNVLSLVEPEECLSRDWMTDRGRAKNAEYDPITDNVEINECRQGMPDAIFDPVPMQIVDFGDRLTIEITEYNTLRTIHMDASTSPEPVAASVGYSTGRWVEETLVVTTTHIDWPHWSEWGLPQSAQASILETYSVSEDGNILNISVTVIDPTMYTRPFTIERTRVWAPSTEIPPYDCVVDWESDKLASVE